MSKYENMNISLDQYIKDSGLDPNTDIPSTNQRMDDEGEMDADIIEIFDQKDEEMEETFSTVEQEQKVRIPSQQWRLAPENIVNNKPEGIPPLIPKNSNFKIDLNHLNTRNSYNHNKNNNYNNRYQNRNQDGNRYRDLRELVPKRHHGPAFRHNQRNNSFNHFNNRGHHGGRHFPNMEFDGPHSLVEMFAGLVQAVLPQGVNQNRNNNYGNQTYGQYRAGLQNARNVNIKDVRFNSNTIRPSPAPAIPSLFAGNANGVGPASLLQPANMIVNSNSAVALTPMTGADVIPTIGNALVGHIQAIQQNFGNKYNIQMQEEIAELQKRPVLYRPAVNGVGEGVDTIDGTGIDDGMVNPIGTNKTMNQRFA